MAWRRRDGSARTRRKILISTQVSAWPLLKLTWDYAGAGSVSHVNAHLMWESVGDLFDMSEAQARMTLEAWCAWTG